MSIIGDRVRLILIVWAIVLGVLLGSGLMSSCAPGKHRANGREYIHETTASNW